MANEDVGERGQWLFNLLMTRPGDRPHPHFRPRFLGDTYPTFDSIDEVVDHPSYFFFAQVKSTTRGYTSGERRLRVQVSREEVDRMVAVPAPTYLVGIDTKLEVGHLLSVNEPRGGVASLTTRHKIDAEVLTGLRDEVIEFWSSRNMVLADSRFKEWGPTMSSAKDPWFVAERGEALAGLLLTSRKDVRVRHERKEDGGTDFLVEIGAGDRTATRIFLVQAKGTLSTDQSVWMRDVQGRFPTRGEQAYLPSCVFVVNVRDNTAYYAWAAAPVADGNAATLKLHEQGTFHPLDRAAVDEIVERVKAWYQALPRRLAPA